MRASPSADAWTAARRWPRSPQRDRARLREVIVDLAAHPSNLLRDRRRELVLTRGLRALGLLREDRQRRFQSVREIAGLGRGLLDPQLAVEEQRVEVVDERLNLRWVNPFKPALRTLAHVEQPRAQLPQRQQTAPELVQAGRDQDQRHDGEHRAMEQRDPARKAMREHRAAQDHHDDDADGPEHGPADDARAQRPHESASIRYPRPRTVWMNDPPSLRRSRATNTSTVFESRSAFSA